MNWLLYTLPENKRFHYLICLWLSLVLVPSLFDNKLTVIQSFFNFICYDILYYYLLVKGHFDR